MYCDAGVAAAGDVWLQGGLSNEAFEDNFVPVASEFSASDVRNVFREREELRTQLEFAADELRQYKPEYVHLCTIWSVYICHPTYMT